MQYLSDSNCVKVFPANYDRGSWSCPNSFSADKLSPDYVKDTELDEVEVDTELLKEFIDVDVNLCLIMTKRSENELYHKYYCYGTDSKDVAYETWSRFV